MKIKLILTAIVAFFVSDAIAISRANRHHQKKDELLQEVIDLMGTTLAEIEAAPENAKKIMDDFQEPAEELTARLNAFVY